MKNTQSSGGPQVEFERIPLSELPQGRHGKHHELMNRIAEQIEALADGEAMKVRSDTLKVSIANLRSAVTRTMSSRGVKIATFCDGNSLFLWKKTAGSARYERKRRERTKG